MLIVNACWYDLSRILPREEKSVDLNSDVDKDKEEEKDLGGNRGFAIERNRV